MPTVDNCQLCVLETLEPFPIDIVAPIISDRREMLRAILLRKIVGTKNIRCYSDTLSSLDDII